MPSVPGINTNNAVRRHFIFFGQEQTPPPGGSALERHNLKLLSLSRNPRRPQRHWRGLEVVQLEQPRPRLWQHDGDQTIFGFHQARKQRPGLYWQRRVGTPRCYLLIPRKQTNRSQFFQKKARTRAIYPHPPSQLPKRPQPAQPAQPKSRDTSPASDFIPCHASSSAVMYNPTAQYSSTAQLGCNT